MMSTSRGSFGLSATYSSKGARKIVPGAPSAGWPKFRRAAISTRIKRGERFCFQGADPVGWSGIGFAARGEQRIWFAHFLAGGVEQGLDHAVFKENSLRVLPSSVRIGAGMGEQTKDPGNLQRFAGQFAERPMKICD